MDAPIATLSLEATTEAGDLSPVTVEIGQPYKVADDEWACAVSVEPLFPNLMAARGGDSFQALFLAVRLALTLLKDFSERGGSLYLKGEPMGDPTRGLFPFEAFRVDL